MYKKLVTYHFVIFSALSVLLYLHSTAFSEVAPASKSTSYLVQDVRADIASNSISITIVGNKVPAYTTHEQFEPFRLVLDMADVEFDKNLDTKKLIPENDFVKLSETTLNDQKPSVTQLVFQIKDHYQYKVERENNNILVRFFPGDKASQPTMGGTSPEKNTPSSDATNVGSSPKNSGASDATIDELIGSSVAALEKKQQNKVNNSSPESDQTSYIDDPFASAGYKKQRISIDFYKIDIHNVFRLLRQVSNLNIVVDESVKGSVTIALNNVPWDFALDIICNLADLKKEERYNTIVIYPKKKDIAWPVSPADTLSIKSDKKTIQQEAMIVQQISSQPKELIEAKEYILKAQAKEKNSDFEEAASFYEHAFSLWPTNFRLSNKLAELYLVNLHINAKAEFFARKSLKLKPNNSNAALFAAIASANMQQVPQAMEYFNQSISGSPPLKEALLSYAAFNENLDHPEAALKLLDKYNQNYGETLDTMLSKARLYDKIGNTTRALSQYRAILSSGYQLRPDLRQYIEGRLQNVKIFD